MTKKTMMISVVFLLLSTASSLNAQDFSSYEQRRLWLLNSLKDVELTDRGKQDLPKACARLWSNPKDAVAFGAEGPKGPPNVCSERQHPGRKSQLVGG